MQCSANWSAALFSFLFFSFLFMLTASALRWCRCRVVSPRRPRHLHPSIPSHPIIIWLYDYDNWYGYDMVFFRFSLPILGHARLYWPTQSTSPCPCHLIHRTMSCPVHSPSPSRWFLSPFPSLVSSPSPHVISSVSRSLPFPSRFPKQIKKNYTVKRKEKNHHHDLSSETSCSLK